MARSKFVIAFTLVGTVLSSAAHALGLGAIEAKSHLNQPLEARIPLLSTDAGEVDSLVVTLASAQAFERAGLSRSFALTKLKFQVVKGDKPFILVTTTQPVKEPFLNFLIEASWGRGRLVREFTLLLDPPVYAQQARPALVAPAKTSSATTAPSNVGPATTAAATLPGAALQGESLPALSEYGPVKSSDTLWKIASRVRPDNSVTINQTMVALYHANPNAFIDGDMNRLKRGQILRVPDRNSMARIDVAKANAEVRAHAERWRHGQESIAAADGAGQPAQDEARAKLKVVAPGGSGGEQAASSLLDRDLQATPETLRQLQNELRLSEESLASLKAENEELKQQVAVLQQQLNTAERLVNISAEQPLAATSVKPAEQAQTQPEAAAEAGEKPAAEPKPAETAQVEAQPSAETKPQQVEQKAAEQKPAAPKPAKPAKKAAPPPPEPGFFDDVTNIGIVGGIGALLAALGYLIWRRRAANKDEAEQAVIVIDTPEAEPEPEPQVEQAPQFDQIDDELTVDAPSADLAPDNDSLGEIDVYMAYGRYDQAQAVAVKALEQDPSRSDLRLKLLEILALLHDRGGFEEQARILRDQVGPSHPDWERAVSMGRDIAPDSPLFRPEGAPSEPAPAAAVVDFGDLDLDPVPEQTRAPIDEPLAFEPAAEPVEQAPAADSADDLVLDFDLDEPAAPARPVEEKPAAAELPSLDFDLSETGRAVESEPLDNVIEFSVPDLGGAPEVAEDDVLDEVSTKLDLARAYLDMGDAEGARSLLDEVLSEGTARQRGEAEALLKQIA